MLLEHASISLLPTREGVVPSLTTQKHEDEESSQDLVPHEGVEVYQDRKSSSSDASEGVVVAMDRSDFSSTTKDDYVHLSPFILRERAYSLFNTIDRAGKGRISADDLDSYFRSVDLPISRSDVEAFITKYSQSGHVSYQEFFEFMKDQQSRLISNFQQLDVNKTGEITKDDVFTFLLKMGLPVSNAQVAQAFTKMDLDRNGSISFVEWHSFWHPLYFQEAASAHVWWPVMTKGHCSAIIHDTVLPEDDIDDMTSKIFHPADYPKWKYMLGGFFAASVSRSMASPLDVVLTNLQMQSAQRPPNASILSRLHGMDFFRQIAAQHGLKGFFRGNAITISRLAPEVAVRNYLYEHLKYRIDERNFSRTNQPSPMQWHQRFFACNLAAITTQTILYPLEFIKTSLQTTSTSSLKDIVPKLFRSRETIKGMYAGIYPTILRICGEISIYETFKAVHLKRQNMEYPTVTATLCMGSIACAVSQTATYPLLHARTVLQGQQLFKSIEGGAKSVTSYKDTADVLRSIYRKEGLKGVYSGWTVNMLRTVPAITANFIAYEFAKKKMEIK